MAEYDLGTARGRIDLDATGAVKGSAAAATAADGIEKSTNRASMSTTALGIGLVSVGAVAVGAFGLMINAAADFEKKMSEFKAVSGATEEQLQSISDKALQLGADTKFSAGEAADAMNELAKSGLPVEAILNGAADATTNLAAAGSIDLAESASIVSAALNQFKLSAEELPHVADLLAGAANASATGVSEIGLALSYVGPVAKATGLSIEDTTAAIALLANNGIDAQKAGTGLRGILSSLIPTSDRAAAAMEELGLITADGSNIFFDSSGKIKSMEEIIGILNGTFGELTEQQRLAYSETIFGREQLAAINAMAATTDDEFSALYKTIGDTSAQEVAETKMDNLSGSVEELKGSIETFLIKGGTPFLKGLQGIVDWLSRAVNWFGELNPVVLKWVGYGVAAAGALALIVGGLILAVDAIKKVKDSFVALNAVMSANPISLVILAIAALVAGLIWLYNNNETFRKGVDKLWETFQPVWDNILSKFQEVWGWVQKNVPPIWDQVVQSLSDGWNWVMTNIWPSIQTFGLGLLVIFTNIKNYVVDSLIPALKDIWEDVEPVVQGLTDFFNNNVKPALESVKTEAENVGRSIDGATDPTKTKENTSSLISTYSSLIGFLTGTVLPTVQDFAQGLINALLSFVSWNQQNMLPALSRLGEFIMSLVPIAQETFFNMVEVIKENLSRISILFGLFFVVGQDLWNRFGSTIGSVIKQAFDTVKQVVENGLRTLGHLLSFWTAIINGDWSRAWEEFQNFFGSIWSTIWAIAEGGVGILRTIINRISSIPMELLRSIGDSLYNIGQKIFEGLFRGMQEKWDQITNWLSGLNPAQFKGPPERDEKMLVESGELIMLGLQNGLADGWDKVSSWLGGVTPMLGTPSTAASSASGGSGDSFTFIFHGMDASEEANVRAAMDGFVLDKITNAARAGVTR